MYQSVDTNIFYNLQLCISLHVVMSVSVIFAVSLLWNDMSTFIADSSTASETQYSLMQFLSLDMTGKVC